MSFRRQSLHVVVLGLLLAACGGGEGSGGGGAASDGGGGAGGAEVEPLTWGACDATDWPLGYPIPSSSVQCALFDVPLDRAKPDGPTVTLRAARQEANGGSKGKALFLLSGGPGGSAVVDSGYMPLLLPELLDDFDFVYLDQRGTGGSNYLRCPDGYPEGAHQWGACADSLASSDLEHYGTVDSALDLDELRVRLGLDKIYVHGGSYGTRLGLEYVRQFPDSIAAVTLDGIAPPDADFFGQNIAGLDTAVRLLAEDCDADAECLAVSPTLADDLLAVRAEREANPQPVLVNGVPFSERAEDFQELLRLLLLDPVSRFEVPRAIHAAALGDRSLWYASVSDAIGLPVVDAAPDGILPFAADPHPWRIAFDHVVFLMGQDPVSPGLFGRITCSEFWPNGPGLEAQRALQDAQAWRTHSILDLGQHCDAWPASPLVPALREPVSSDVPVLLLSGGIDVQTPASNGDHALETLSKGSHVVVPYMTHGTIAAPCARDIMRGFLLAEGDMSKVDSSCLAEVTHPDW